MRDLYGRPSGSSARRAPRWPLDLSPVQRQGKIQKECGPISNEHLRASCVDSRNIDEDRRALGLRDGLTGGGDGRMNPIDRTFQGPEMYDPRFGR